MEVKLVCFIYYSRVHYRTLWQRSALLCTWYAFTATPPPRCLLPCKSAYTLVCFLLYCFLAFISFIFFLFLAFFYFDLDVDVFHPVFFLWVLCCLLSFCCDSLSVRIMCIWYVRTLISLFFFVWRVRFVWVIACIIFCFFSSWGNLPLQNYWRLSCDHGLHCGDELMWEPQQQQRSSAKRALSVFTQASLDL